MKEQLQVLIESGYTLEEIEGWRKNISAEGIKIKGNQICLNDFGYSVTNVEKKISVTGFSFNAQDLFQNYQGPLPSTYWDPQNFQQQQQLRTCLPPSFCNKNNLFKFATSSPTSAAKEKNHAQTPNERAIFFRTSPHQIIRQNPPSSSIFPLLREEQSPPTPQKPLMPLAGLEPSTQEVQNSPNTTSSKKSSQRGRPLGSKNKPVALPVDYLEPVPGEDGVTTRAQRAWLIGKQLGLKPRGSEALMLRGLKAQIRENHPHLN